MEILKYQKELHELAYNLCKDYHLAEDVVQEVFIVAIEQNIVEKKRLLGVCAELVEKEKKCRNKEPGSALNGYQSGQDEDGEVTIWKKLADNGPLQDQTIDAENEKIAELKKHVVPGSRWLPFPLLREFVRSLDLSGQEAYQAFYRSYPKECFPYDPRQVYPSEWKNWEDFVGHAFYSFEEFLVYARSLTPLGINSAEKFLRHSHPKRVPRYPSEHYRTEWVSWPHAFGKEITRSTMSNWDREILSYEEGAKYVKENLVPIGIDTLAIWNRRIAEIPLFLPSQPANYWKGIGWIDSSHFFGTNKRRPGEPKNFRPYTEARQWVLDQLKPMGIDSYPKFRAFVMGTFVFPPGVAPFQLPDDIPKQPETAYRNKGWLSQRHFFATSARVSVKERTTHGLWSYEKSKEWIKENLKGRLINSGTWKQYVRGELSDLPDIPSQMPKRPYQVFERQKTWISWNDFLDSEISIERRRSTGKPTVAYLSYDKAKQYIREELRPRGIDSWTKYIAYPNLPPFLPVTADKYYKKDGRGWVSYKDFIGDRLPKNFKRKRGRPKGLK